MLSRINQKPEKYLPKLLVVASIFLFFAGAYPASAATQVSGFLTPSGSDVTVNWDMSNICSTYLQPSGDAFAIWGIGTSTAANAVVGSVSSESAAMAFCSNLDSRYQNIISSFVAGRLSYGNYILGFYSVTTGPYILRAYIPLTYSSSGISGPTPASGASFTNFAVSAASGTIDIAGYWNTSASSTVSLTFHETSATLGLVQSNTETATSSGPFHFILPIIDSSFAISATSSAYTLGSDMTFTGEIDSTPDDFDPFLSTTSQNTVLAATSTMLTASSTVTVNTGSAASLAGLPEPEDCSLGNLAGCFKNAAVWLFYPTTNSVSQFGSLSLEGKFPFEYIYQVGQIRNAVFTASSTAPTSLSVALWKLNGATSTITLLSEADIAAVPFSGVIYSVLDFLIWLGLVEFIYYRVIRVHDVTTPQ